MFKSVTPDRLNICSPNSPGGHNDRIALFVYREVEVVPRQTTPMLWSPVAQVTGRGAMTAPTAALRDCVQLQ